jgi:hypothetical protein
VRQAEDIQTGRADLERIEKRLRGLPLKRSSFAVSLYGEAGIGKSYVVQKLLRSSACSQLSLHATAPLTTWVNAAPRPRKLPAWAEAAFQKWEHGGFIEESLLLDALVAALGGAAPFVLHVEDLHEASTDRLEWLTKLGEALVRTRGVAMIVTSRVQPPAVFEALRLEPMTLDETRALLESEIGTSLPLLCSDWIQTRAGGNPLFTLEFFRHLARQGLAWNDGKRWHWRPPPLDTMPVSVEALIERLLWDATGTDESIATVAALALLGNGLNDGWGSDSSTALIVAVSGLSAEVLTRTTAQLCAEGVLTNAWGFAHPLYREVARSSLRTTDLRQFARRALSWLQTRAPERAIEFIEAAELEPLEALELFNAGIQRLRAEGRTVEAARLEHRSLNLRQAQDRAQTAISALRILHDVDFVIASELLELALSGEHPSALEAAFLAEQLAARGREAQALELLEQLEDAERSGVRWLEWRVRIAALAGNSGTVLELVEAHPALLESRQPEVLQRLVHILASSGRSAEAMAVGVRGLDDLPLSVEERVGLLQTTATAAFYGAQFQEAIELWSQSIDLATVNGLAALAMKTTINRAQALIRIGQKARAETDLKAASELARQFGDRRVHMQSLVLLGVTLTERQDFERAETVLLEALALFPEGRFPELRINAEFALTELYRVWILPQGHFLMCKYARQALRHADETGNLILKLSATLGLSSAELRIGNPRRALELADEAVREAQNHDRHFQEMSALRCRAAALGALQDIGAALESWREAIDLAERLNLPLHAQENRLEVDHLKRDLNGAQERLAWFELNNHPLEAAKARLYFPELNDEIKPLESQLSVPQLSVQLEVLGGMQLNAQPLRGRKRQELLATLLESRIAGRSEVTKLELMDAMYSDSDEDQAANALKETVRLTRQNLGAATIETTANGYALGAIHSDAEEFLETGNTALWRGAYLSGLNPRDEQVSESLHNALLIAAEKQLETNPKDAARLSRYLTAYDPFNLEFLRLTLRALRASDNHKSLNRAYAEARDRLVEVGERLPERWQDFLNATKSA